MNSQGFSTVFCTSEDPNHPFENLFRDDTPSGWISLPSPNFPVEAIIDTKNLFVLTGMDIVSHESMIATKVDLYGSKDDELNQTTQWFSIGYFTFNSNQRSQWVARELKHVSIDSCTLRFLRILIEGVYETPPNRDHRISFISLTLNGHREIKPRMNNLEELIEDLKNAKLQAIEEENYGAADLYKNELLNIEENKEELERLFNNKAEALKNEEYLDVDSIMNSINAIIKKGRIPQDQIPIQTIQQQQQQQQEQEIPIEEPSFVPDETKKPGRKEKPIIKDTPSTVQVGAEDGFFLTDFDKGAVLAIASDEQFPIQNNDNNGDQSPREEEFPPDPEPAPPPPPKKPKKPKNKLPPPTKSVNPPKERAPRFAKGPPDIDKRNEQPDELSDENKAEANTLISVFGEKVVAIAYSSNWSLRVSGLEKLCELIKGLKTAGDKTRALSGILPLLRRRFSDGLKATYVSAIEQTISLLDALNVEGNELGTIIHVLLPISMGKLGDTNQRISDISKQFCLWCANKDKWALTELQQYTLHPPNPNQYHQQIAKLNLLTVLMEQYGVGNEKGKLKLPDVMGLVVPCLDSRKEEVRKLAIKITQSLQEQFGSVIDKYLKNVSRLVKEQLSK